MARVEWERLGREVFNRRIELGMVRQQDLVEATGMTRRTLSAVENGRRDNYDPETLLRLERALRWSPGSVQAVLNGGDPRPATEPPVAVPTDGMDPLAAEVVYLLGPDSPLGEEDKDDMRDLFGHLIKRYRTIARIEQREAGNS